MRTVDMRTKWGGALALACALLASSNAANADAPAAPKFTVHIKGFAYVPASLRVHVGDRVRFVNDDDEPHTVTASDKSFDSAGLDTNGTWDHVFGKPGRYDYFCELHPYMKAAVVVTR